MLVSGKCVLTKATMVESMSVVCTVVPAPSAYHGLVWLVEPPLGSSLVQEVAAKTKATNVAIKANFFIV